MTKPNPAVEEPSITDLRLYMSFKHFFVRYHVAEALARFRRTPIAACRRYSDMAGRIIQRAKKQGTIQPVPTRKGYYRFSPPAEQPVPNLVSPTASIVKAQGQ